MQLNDQEIIERIDRLPAFPGVVVSLLAALDDEDATLGTLAQHVERDPAVAGKVMALANSAVMRAHGQHVHDLVTATSMIGLTRVREIVLGVSLAEFTHAGHASPTYWEHSIATAIAAQELARGCGVPTEKAFVTGLLHDIGQLWLNNNYPLQFASARRAVINGEEPVLLAERRIFGTDHCHVGSLMCRHWQLPEEMIDAVSLHHEPDALAQNKLIALIHVAEVLANALDLGRREENQVVHLSAAACTTLGLDWGSEQMIYLFGKIEARTGHATQAYAV